MTAQIRRSSKTFSAQSQLQLWLVSQLTWIGVNKSSYVSPPLTLLDNLTLQSVVQPQFIRFLMLQGTSTATLPLLMLRRSVLPGLMVNRKVDTQLSSMRCKWLWSLLPSAHSKLLQPSQFKPILIFKTAQHIDSKWGLKVRAAGVTTLRKSQSKRPRHLMHPLTFRLTRVSVLALLSSWAGRREHQMVHHPS